MIRNFQLATLASVLLFTGCAVGPPALPPQPVLVTTVAPRCVAPKQCEGLWIKAQDSVSMASGMKLRMVTESRLETFSPTTYGRLGAVVTKVPQDDGAYRIQVRFWCYYDSGQGCENHRNSATNLFNTLLGPGEPVAKQ